MKKSPRYTGKWGKKKSRIVNRLGTFFLKRKREKNRNTFVFACTYILKKLLKVIEEINKSGCLGVRGLGTG